MKRKIIIRADGGPTIGMGHIIRCLALAEMLKQEYAISFAVQAPSETVLFFIRTITTAIIQLPETADFEKDFLLFAKHITKEDIVLLDGYQFQTKYQKGIKETGCKLVCIDDLHSWHHHADAIINHAEGITYKHYSSEPYTEYCLGLKYALLRPPFLKKESPKKITSLKRIFISMGAADFDNNTYKFAEALSGFNEIQEIHLLVSAINPYLKQLNLLICNNSNIQLHSDLSAEKVASLLSVCDLAICPASSISIECCAIGIGMISGYTAENQRGILNGLDEKNVLINWQSLTELSVETIRNKFKLLLENSDLLSNMVQEQRILIDGKSPERFRYLFARLSSEPLHFRFAMESDADLYYRWANDPAVRSNSFNPEPILYENHLKWFSLRIHNPDYFFYLFFNDEGVPVGQVRIERSNKENVIDISIDADFRGQSFGKVILGMACTDYLQRFPSNIIHSYVKKENKASYDTFKKVNFIDEKEVKMGGFDVFKLRLEKTANFI